MNAAWTRGGEANPQSPGELGIAAGHQGRCLLMPHLHEADAILALPQRLHDAVNAIARQPEDGIDTPLEQAFHHTISGSSSHGFFPESIRDGVFKEQPRSPKQLRSSMDGTIERPKSSTGRDC